MFVVSEIRYNLEIRGLVWRKCTLDMAYESDWNVFRVPYFTQNHYSLIYTSTKLVYNNCFQKQSLYGLIRLSAKMRLAEKSGWIG